MNKLEKILSKWNFKKIVVWYLILAIITGVTCVGSVGFIYRERLNFAWQYSRLEESKDETSLKAAVDKTAASSADVIDVLILDTNNNVTYSAKNSEFASGTFQLVKSDSKSKYLISTEHIDAAFRYVKSEEFLLSSIINKDFYQIRSDYDDDSFFETDLAQRSIYMLSRVGISFSDDKIYVITSPTSVSGGMIVIKISAALAMMFFCIYWVLIALWMYRDAAKCKFTPLYWGLIGLLTNLIGLIVYKIYKRSLAICTVCGTAQSADHMYCSDCGAQLGARCERCGSKISSKDNFCHHCGSKIE